jgi:hypothetical protein
MSSVIVIAPHPKGSFPSGAISAHAVDRFRLDHRRGVVRFRRPLAGGIAKFSTPGSVGPPCTECGSVDVSFVQTTRGFDEYWCRIEASRADSFSMRTTARSGSAMTLLA